MKDDINRKKLREEIESLEINITGISPKILKIIGDEWRKSVLNIIDEAPSIID